MRSNPLASVADAQIESGSPPRHQGIRNEQVEGDRRESWQTSKGSRDRAHEARKRFANVIYIGVRAVCQRAFWWSDIALVGGVVAKL